MIKLIRSIEKISDFLKQNNFHEAGKLAIDARAKALAAGRYKLVEYLDSLMSNSQLEGYRSEIQSVDLDIASVDKTQNTSIGVHIHVYYPDISEELIKAVSNIKSKKYVYISTCNESNVETINSQLRKYGINEENSIVAVTENRGRNFGPMLVHFRENLMNHEIILHLHTKKSLRTGQDQVIWRQSSWNCLCGTSQICENIVNSFIRKPKLGLVGPIALQDYSSYWWRSWLSVGHLLPDFFKKINIYKYPKKSFIQFPIGSMFWARTESLLPLLKCNWSYEDFPPEPFPDDGTLAHVIERSIGYIAEHNGYEYLESDVQNNKHSISKPPSLGFDYHSSVKYLNHTPREKIVSFDFFDTLFMRVTTSPEDIYDYIGFHLKDKKGVYNGYFFKEWRKKAEALARSASSTGEVGIDAIYESFRIISNWKDLDIAYAKATEISLEMKMLVPRHTVIDFARRAKQSGSRLIIISDTYLPSSFIFSILEKWGISDLFDHIYVSCETNFRKDWGDIWLHIIKTECLVPWSEEYLHIGDNEQSDVQQALRNSVRAIGVLNPAVMYDVSGLSLPENWRFGSGEWVDNVVIGPVISRVCNSPIFSAQDAYIKLQSRDDIGYCIFGPMLYGFVHWLVNLAHGNPALRNLAFIARDGWYLKAAYDKVLSILPSGYAPPSSYVMTSRQALLASTDCKNLSDYVDALLDCGNFSGSLSDFLKERISFDINCGDGVLNLTSNRDSDRNIIIECLQANYASLINHTKKNREGLMLHLHNVGFDEYGTTALVDLGYAGTIQYLLQDILNINLEGFYFAINSKSSKLTKRFNGKAHGCYGDSRAPNTHMSYIEAYSMFLESVFTAPHQKVIGYSSVGKPLLSNRIDNNISFSEDVNVGALKYIDDLLCLYGSDVLKIPFNQAAFITTFKDFVQNKYILTSELKMDFSVDDNFCGNGVLNPFLLYGMK